MKSTFTTLVALISLIPLALPAQTEQPVPLGGRVRITVTDTTRTGAPPDSAPRFVIGQLVAFDDSTMSVRNEGGSGDVTVPRSRVQRLEVCTGSTRGRNAIYGAVIGLGVGGILGYAGGENCSDAGWCFFPRDETAVVGAFLGATLGGLIGVVVGHGDRWRETAVPARVTVVPTGARSLSVSSTLRF